MTSQSMVKEFFDEATNTFSYVVSDTDTGQCAIIDSVLNYEPNSATTSTYGADAIIEYIQAQKLSVQWILETHIHADHMTAAHYLKSKLGGSIAMSNKLHLVQEIFSKIYNIDAKNFNLKENFDYLFEDHERFKIGNIEAYNIPTPGHTPACLSYVIDHSIFVGDTLFMPDYGTARCDFPKGDAGQLFESIQLIYQLPENIQMYLCHDYLPENRQKYEFKTTIRNQKLQNIHINEKTSKIDFVKMRNTKDSTLSMPKLILPSMQINLKAGKFPEAEDNDLMYLKIPFNYFET